MKKRKGWFFELKKFLLYHWRERNHYADEHKYFKDKQVQFYNWCEMDPDYWIIRFIKERGLLQYFGNKTISIYSVFGHRYNIYRNKSDFKFFFTGENVHTGGFSHSGKYNDLFLKSKKIDLSIGFDYVENEKYVRFPLWITYLFEPDATLDQITETCNMINSQDNYHVRDKFCAFLSRMDRYGFREDFYNQVSKIGRIDCDGLFKHNSDDLKNIYNDDKIAYLRTYKFNLCPENSNFPGYCTEKVFESIKAGAIPIYWGTDNNPEPEILNHDRIIFIEPFKENEKSLNLIRELEKDRSMYLNFARQKGFTEDAPKHIYNLFLNLETKIADIARKKNE